MLVSMMELLLPRLSKKFLPKMSIKVATLDDLEIGDFVTGYNDGYHIVLRKFPEMGAPAGCVELQKVVNGNGTISSKRTSTCNVTFCIKVDKAYGRRLIEDRESDLEQLRLNLLKFCKD